MNRTEKIQALESRLDALTAPKPVSLTQQLIDEELENLRADIGNRVSTRAIDKVQADFKGFSEKFKLEPVFEAISKADSDNKKGIVTLQQNFEKRLNDLIKVSLKASKEEKQVATLSRKEILGQIASIRLSFDGELNKLISRDTLLAAEADRLAQGIQRIELRLSEETAGVDAKEALTKTAEIQKELADLDKRITSRIGSLQNNHGGNMNRNVAIAGNTSVLSKYTDINLKAGANVTITYTANNTTKYTDVTIAATGGGGGSGITRQISNVSTPTVMDATASIDQVYLVSGNTTMTLPDASGNLNLYTVKNVGTGTVIINTTGGQTIDGDTTVTMPVQYTSVDLISNGSNWDIT